MESFLKGITVRENCFLEQLKNCECSGLQTYVYGGGGLAAKNVTFFAKELGYSIAGMLVNRIYMPGNGDVLCLEDLLDRRSDKVNIIIGFTKFGSQLDLYREKINILLNCSEFCWSNWKLFGGLLTREKIAKYADKIQVLFDNVQDDLSRQSIVAFLNQKLSMQGEYMHNIRSKSRQYLEKEILQLSDDEVFIDCGAYDGDSAKDFIDELHDRGINKYDQIISFEPDKKNYELLKKREFKNHLCIQKGTSDKTGTVTFSSDDTSSVIDANGTENIELDTIDNVLGGNRATLIKMDIEGAELASLQGAEKTITKYHPKLAICIYHKLEDLWEIPNYIHSIVPEYKFYVRGYSDHAIELVLYAIP